MDRGKVSIVVTSYNYGKYISDCLNSILKQKYQNYEVIIIDDGSTDNTEEIVEPFLQNPKIQYFKQENMGQAVANNNGIKKSTGEFIVFLDADDMWDKNMLEKEMRLFSDNNVGVVYSGVKFIDEQGNDIDFRHKNKHILPKAGNITKYLLFENFVTSSTSIIRRECFEKCGCFDESIKMGIDWDMWLRISTRYQFSYAKEPLLIYRIHFSQMSKDRKDDGTKQSDSDRIMKKFFQQNPNLLPKSVVRKAWAYAYNNRANYFYNSNPRSSFEFRVRSIREWPLQFIAYKDLLVFILRRFIKQFKKGNLNHVQKQ